MISTPKLSEAPVETLMMAGVGFVAGAALRVNASLTAAVLAISTIANYLFFEAANRWARPVVNGMQSYFEMTPELTYAVTCALVSSVTFVALCKFDLLSKRVSAALIFLSLGTFAARIRLVYQP